MTYTRRVVLTLLVLTVGTAAAGVPRKGLVAYWPMDKGQGGTAPDASGHDHALQLRSAEWTKGAIDGGLRLHGSSRVDTPSTEALTMRQEVTVSCWVRVDRVPGNLRGIGLVNGGLSYLLRISSGRVPSFHIRSDDDWAPVQGSRAMALGKWYHLVGSYDGESMRIYVNGDLVALRRLSGRIDASDRPIRLGRQVNRLTGCLDEVAIWNRALGEKRVAKLFRSNRDRLRSEVRVGKLQERYQEQFGHTRDNPAPLPSAALLPESDLTFVVHTDTHIGVRGQEGIYCHNWRVEEAIRQINALKPDFTVNCGDIITGFPSHNDYHQNCRYARKLLTDFEVPYYLVAGNHDIGNQQNLQRKDQPDDWFVNEGTRTSYLKYFGEDYYAFTREGYRFVVLNDELCNSDLGAEKKQMQFLKEQLRRGKNAKATFMFAHNPLFWNRPGEPGPKNYENVNEPARSRLLDILRKHRPAALFTGHTHWGFANWYSGVWFRTLNSTTFNRHFGFRKHLSGGAWSYDPFKLGYLVVRAEDGRFHESWTPLYWPVPDPPKKKEKLYGRRIVARPASEAEQSVLGVRTRIPRPREPGGSREVVNDHWWRLAEDLGSRWQMAWPMPKDDEGWKALERALTRGRPRGVSVAVHLPGERSSMKEVWRKLKALSGRIGAVVVRNGAPAKTDKPLSSWQVRGDADGWARMCAAAGRLVPADTKVVLGRIPLDGKQGLRTLRSACAAAEDTADAVSVILDSNRPVGAEMAGRIAEAASIARRHDLRLWLDAACWEDLSPARRTAQFLRLLAVCEAQKVRVFWWPRPRREGGLLDRHWDPTRLYYAAQAWQTAVDGPSRPVSVDWNDGVELRWQDSRGRTYRVWWRSGGEDTVRLAKDSSLGGEYNLVDPYYGRLMTRVPSGKRPVALWPIIARE